MMTEKGWKAIVKAAPDHVDSVRKRFIDNLSTKDQEEIARIFDRIGVELRHQYSREEK